MDELSWELELLRKMEEEEEGDKEAPEPEVIASPYQNARQEAMGQMMSIFRDADDILYQLALEEQKKREEAEASEE